MVSFSALLGRSCGDFLGDADPVVWSIPAHKLDQVAVLMLRPRAATVSNHVLTSRVSSPFSLRL